MKIYVLKENYNGKAMKINTSREEKAVVHQRNYCLSSNNCGTTSCSLEMAHLWKLFNCRLGRLANNGFCSKNNSRVRASQLILTKGITREWGVHTLKNL